jgi:Na+-driven multidrug efflux pump
LLGTVFGALLFAAYWLVSPILFKIALPKYLESLAYSRVLMGGLVLSVPFNYIGSVFRSQKMVRAIFLSSFAARTPAVILYFAFGLTWGVWGMVWANVTGTAIAVLGTLIIWEIESRRLLRLAKINIREVPPISNDESFI